MGFYDILEENNLTQLLHRVTYIQPEFRNFEKVKEYILDIVDNNRRVLIYGDYDMDGLMCTQTISESLKLMKHHNYDIYKYRKRTHMVDPYAVQECIQGQYEYCIICDAGSHDLGLLKKLLSYGIKVVLLDHHRTNISYEEFDELDGLTIINTMLEDRLYKLSAGALCFCVMYAICLSRGIDNSILSIYGMISLFSDCMDMSDELNRSIYFLATRMDSSLIPPKIKMFMTQYHKLNARFVNFWLSPRINALFRAEYFEPINKLFIESDNDTTTMVKYLTEVNSIYEDKRDLVTKVADLIDVTEWENFVIANIDSVNKYYSVTEYKLWNYTGLIANKLADRYGKTAFAYCREGNKIKGSVRDLLGRDYLSIFSQICEAGGHNPAFGVRINALDFDEFMQYLSRVDKKYAITTVNNKPIVLEYKYNEPDISLIEDIALINEFTSSGVPMILLQKQRVGDMKETKTDYGYKYKWGGYEIQSSHAKAFGSKMLLKPYRSWHTKLLVQ